MNTKESAQGSMKRGWLSHAVVATGPLNGKGEVGLGSPMMLDPKIDTASTRERGLGSSPAIFARLRLLFLPLVADLMLIPSQNWRHKDKVLTFSGESCLPRSGSNAPVWMKELQINSQTKNHIHCNAIFTLIIEIWLTEQKKPSERFRWLLPNKSEEAGGTWSFGADVEFGTRLDAQLARVLVRIELLTRRQQEESVAESSPNAQKSKPARVNSAAQNMRPEQHSGTTPNHNRRDSLLRGEKERESEREPPSYPL